MKNCGFFRLKFFFINKKHNFDGTRIRLYRHDIFVQYNMMLKFHKDIFKDFRVVNFYKNDFFAYFISRNSYPSHSLSHGI